MNLTRLKEARQSIGHNIATASAIIKVSTTTLVGVENGYMPKSEFIQIAIAAYIKKYLPESKTKKKK